MWEMLSNMKVTAIVLAAGKGSRMKSDIPKQFMELEDKPIIYYSLKAFEESCVDSVVVVTIPEMIQYIEKDIVEKYSIKKVDGVIRGSVARYLSVYEGLLAIKDSDYVLVHDSARPFVSVEMINSIVEAVKEKKAVIPGVPVKDTIKQINELGYVDNTPDRNMLVAVQTPQAFVYDRYVKAYEKIDMSQVDDTITDDSCVWERFVGKPVFVIKGEETNIKITTPEDFKIVKTLINKGF